jgi:hypothetical protein
VPIDSGQTRVLSPELALVDDELGAWARLRLQEDAVAAEVAAAAALEAPPRAVVETAAGDEFELDRRRRSLWPLSIAVVVAAAIIAAVAVAVRPSSDGSPKPTAATGVTPGASVPFAWPGVSAARAYVFTLSRGTTVIYRARTTAQQLALKRSWKYEGRRYTLRRGAYRWRVTALVDSPSGSRIVVSAPFWINGSG